MRFLVDECTGTRVALWLRQQNHDVFSIFDEARGISDDDIIDLAVSENRILITNDRDFSSKIFRDHRLHSRVIFLRLEDERLQTKSLYWNDFSQIIPTILKENSWLLQKRKFVSRGVEHHQNLNIRE